LGCRGLHARYFVEKDRTAVGQLEEPALGPLGVGEGPLFITEELALEQIFRDGGAVDLDHGLFSARAGRMDGISRQLLAGAALPFEQHRGARGFGDDLDQIEDLLDGGAFTIEARFRRAAALLFLEAGDLQLEAMGFERLGHHQLELVQLEGLEQIVVGARFQRLHRGTGVGQGGDHDHQQLRLQLTDARQHLQPAFAGQLDVEQNQVDQPLLEPRQRLLPARCGLDKIALSLHHIGDGFAEILIILDDENARLHLLSPSVGSITRKVVPSPILLETLISPSCAAMMR